MPTGYRQPLAFPSRPAMVVPPSSEVAVIDVSAARAGPAAPIPGASAPAMADDARRAAATVSVHYIAELMSAAHSQGAAVPPGSELKYSQPATPPKSECSATSWLSVPSRVVGST